MKKLVLGFSLFIVFACQNKTQETALIKETPTIEEKSLVDVYDYAELEPLLNIKDDKTYVINFWATWCAPCIRELPYFQELHENYKDKNLEVIFISLDFPGKMEKSLLPFIKKRKINSRVILLDDADEKTWIPKIDPNWDGGIPATLIYNEDKRTFYAHAFTKESLLKEVNKFISLD